MQSFIIPGDWTFFLNLGDGENQLSVADAQGLGLRVMPDGTKHGEYWQAELRPGTVVSDDRLIAAIQAQNIPLSEAA